jgi:hypothetical protein
VPVEVEGAGVVGREPGVEEVVCFIAERSGICPPVGVAVILELWFEGTGLLVPDMSSLLGGTRRRWRRGSKSGVYL